MRLYSTLAEDPVVRGLQLYNLGIKTRHEVMETIAGMVPPVPTGASADLDTFFEESAARELSDDPNANWLDIQPDG